LSELDEAWELALAAAQRRAHRAGRADVAAYLRLRSSNDLVRKTGIDWLLNTFSVLAGQANRAGASLQISQQEGHRFQVTNATMVGPCLTLSFGVRSLSIEAGWPRVPGDSFIRGGGLARGRIRHLGKQTFNQELQLVQATKGSPSWLVIDKEGKSSPLLESGIRRHLIKLLSPDYR
jgi:hypothetical protein